MSKPETNEERLERERDLLGSALGKILIAAGIICPGANMTGPMLLMEAAELVHDLDSDRVRLFFKDV